MVENSDSQRIKALQRQGYTMAAIARASKLGSSTIYAMLNGRQSADETRTKLLQGLALLEKVTTTVKKSPVATPKSALKKAVRQRVAKKIVPPPQKPILIPEKFWLVVADNELHAYGKIYDEGAAMDQARKVATERNVRAFVLELTHFVLPQLTCVAVKADY